MTRATLCAALIVAFAACSSESCSTDSGLPERSNAQKAVAVESCRRVFARLAAGRDAFTEMLVILEGCADLHAAPECADAWRRAARTTPDRRIATAAEGCRAAYCPHLPSPKPALCYRQNRDMTATELGREWVAFERVILTRDMDALATVVLDHLEAHAMPVALPAPAPTPRTPPALRLTVARDGDAVVVSRSDAPDLEVTLTGEATADRARIAPLVEGFQAATLGAAPSLQYQDVLRVMDALREAGVTDILFAAGPDGGP
jgi:biopolymer transport protein ExbD